VRFFDADILQLTPCCRCGGKFVAHRHDLQNNVVCGACQPPSRAGKTKKAAAARRGAEQADSNLPVTTDGIAEAA
jgi:flagellar transcriptional activator FlhC